MLFVFWQQKYRVAPLCEVYRWFNLLFQELGGISLDLISNLETNFLEFMGKKLERRGRAQLEHRK